MQSAQIEKILRSPVDNTSSFSQCWSSDGQYFATAHDQRVTLYSVRNDYAVLMSLRLRCCVASVDITPCRGSNGSDGAGELAFLLVVGTAFGAFLYKVQALHTHASSQDDEDGSQSTVSPPVLASVLPEVPICLVKFSHDGQTVAMGSVDGRLYVRDLAHHHERQLQTFGREVFAKVLAAPRVTAMSFSSCDSKVAVTTRKGNVYVLTRGLANKWQLHLPCSELTGNPKAVAVSSSSATSGASGGNSATAMQTFVCWWDNRGLSASPSPSPVFVVGSRAANYRLEMFDVNSGKLLHSVQFARNRRDPDSSSGAATEADLLTGLCCLQLPNGRSSLVCHDTDSSLSIVTWPFLDVVCCPSSR